MNATLGNYPAAEMKASDADRDAVLSELSEHFQAGRLTSAEFDERAGQALAARTYGELRNLLRDLPAARPGPQAPAATSSAAPSQRPSWPALLPVAALAGIAIAVVVSVGVAHHRPGFLGLLLLVLFVARRWIRCTGASKRSGVARL
jgi:beta-phosphoglucomutase-like phosphatase (HAD superfamily)